MPEWALLLTCVVGVVVLTVVTAWLTALFVRQRAWRQARDEALREQPHIIEELEEMQKDTTALLNEERRKNAALEEEHRAQQARTQELTRRLKDYERLRQRMGKTLRVFHQPALVLGPRAVGKSSLIRQWDAPWDYQDVEASRAHRVCQVPVCELRLGGQRKQEPAAPDPPLPTRVLLGLRLHDFPGEMEAQRHILTQVGDETLRLRKASQRNLGVILICMFDADEACNGIRAETNEYYNGQLFRELRLLFARGEIDLTRLILVYNKADLLRRQQPPGTPDEELLALCRSSFASTCEPLRAIVHAEHVREVLTVLSRGETGLRSEGAATVKAEAIRPLVEAFRDPAVDGPVSTGLLL